MALRELDGSSGFFLIYALSSGSHVAMANPGEEGWPGSEISLSPSPSLSLSTLSPVSPSLGTVRRGSDKHEVTSRGEL